MKWPAFILFALLLPLTGLVHAQTVVWSDNFETNAGSRWTTSSTWKIGSPTAGPGKAYAGSECAGTGLTGNAPQNSDSRLICTNYNGATNLFVPAANLFPRLRFWQWFNSVNAEGWVEIRVAGTNIWQSISITNPASFNTYSIASGGWSSPSLDLRAFAGQNVQIAFHFVSGGNGYGNDLGWYVDNVELEAGQPVLNSPESFESGLGDWSVDSGTWQVGQPVSGPGSAHSGTNCAGTALSGTYGWNVDSRLISPLFYVPSSSSQSLHFWQWYSFVNALGYIEVNNGTNGWQTISATNISVGSSASVSGGWKTNAINLSSYAGETVQVAFHFASGGSGYGNAAGWFIDDLNLWAAPVLAVPTSTLSLYPGYILTVTNVATLNPPGPATFAVLSGAPANSTLNPTNGIFTWAPTTAQAGTTATITLSVTDTNGLSATNSFVVQVLSPPVLTVPAGQTIYAGQTLIVTNFATNSSAPTAVFNYLDGLASPTNILLNATNGVLSWTPFSRQAGSYEILMGAVQVSPTNPPPPFVSNSFSVVVLLPPSPVLKAAASSLNTSGFNFSSTGNINGVSWQIETSTNLSNWSLLTNITVSNSALHVTDQAATNNPYRFYRAVLP